MPMLICFGSRGPEIAAGVPFAGPAHMIVSGYGSITLSTLHIFIASLCLAVCMAGRDGRFGKGEKIGKLAGGEGVRLFFVDMRFPSGTHNRQIR